MTIKRKDVLQEDESGKPKLKLIPLEKTAVFTANEKEYWNLMRIYEAGGWRWTNGKLPTQVSPSSKFNRKDYIQAGSNTEIKTYFNGPNFMRDTKEFYQRKGWQLISMQNFYEQQGLTQKVLQEINGNFSKKSFQK